MLTTLMSRQDMINQLVTAGYALPGELDGLDETRLIVNLHPPISQTELGGTGLTHWDVVRQVRNEEVARHEQAESSKVDVLRAAHGYVGHVAADFGDMTLRSWAHPYELAVDHDCLTFGAAMRRWLVRAHLELPTIGDASLVLGALLYEDELKAVSATQRVASLQPIADIMAREDIDFEEFMFRLRLKILGLGAAHWRPSSER